MRKILLLPVLAALVVVMVILQLFVFLPENEGTYENLFFRFNVWSYPVKMYVPTEKNKTIYLGVSVEKDEINFGIVPFNSKVVKFINITNNNDKEIEVKIICKGNITKFLKFQQTFKLKPKEVKTIRVEADAKELGNFTGEINVITIIPKFW
jgi:hypothetical protein